MIAPTLDAEFITNERVFSSQEIAKTPSGIPTPAIITRAVHNLTPFSSIEILDLGLIKTPQNTTYHSFGLTPSDSITKGANIDARSVFEKGMKAGRSYELKGSYLILAQSLPCAEITAAATALALGYDCKNNFSSSSLHVAKKETINKALSLLNDKMSNFERLSHVSDNMLIFCAGFLLEASRRFHVVLSGGMEMATVLLIADKLREDVLMRLKSDNITLATTSYIANEKESNIAHLLSQLSYTPHVIYTTFSFKETSITILKKYDEGELKDSAGAGASLAYAYANKIENKQLLVTIECMLYAL